MISSASPSPSLRIPSSNRMTLFSGSAPSYVITFPQRINLFSIKCRFIAHGSMNHRVFPYSASTQS